ncbi:MAG: hypothetical protein JO107_05470 [Hyphomicrobiales bacterium]|nr:hypothetical protein [Hyphomicrobiales bacterium]MBV8662532.1 hypothetical protein [Hyphomicrobiales bacterium]
MKKIAMIAACLFPVSAMAQVAPPPKPMEPELVVTLTPNDIDQIEAFISQGDETRHFSDGWHSYVDGTQIRNFLEQKKADAQRQAANKLAQEREAMKKNAPDAAPSPAGQPH